MILSCLKAPHFRPGCASDWGTSFYGPCKRKGNTDKRDVTNPSEFSLSIPPESSLASVEASVSHLMCLYYNDPKKHERNLALPMQTPPNVIHEHRFRRSKSSQILSFELAVL